MLVKVSHLGSFRHGLNEKTEVLGPEPSGSATSRT